MDCDISESCYKGTILQRNYRKNDNIIVIFLQFFCKFQGYFFLSHNMFMLYPNLCYNNDSVPDFFSKTVSFQKHQQGTKKHGK